MTRRTSSSRFVSSDRIASFSGEADVEPTIPTASGRFDLSKFSLGLLFPYYKSVLAVDVQKGSLDLASRFALDAKGNLTLSEGVASIADLQLALPGNRQPLWRVPTLAAGGVDVDVRARKVTIGDLQSRGAVLRLVRERDGSLEVARMSEDAGDGRNHRRRRVDARHEEGRARARGDRLRGSRAGRRR